MAEKEKPQFTFAQKKKAIVRHLLPYRSVIIYLAVFGVLSAAANGVIPYITGKFFDGLITPHATTLPWFGSTASWAALLLLWAVVQIAANAISWLSDRESRVLTTRVQAVFQAEAFITMLRLPLEFFKKNRAGELTNIIDRASWQVQMMIGTITSLAPQFLTILIGIGISFTINAGLATLLLVGVVIYALALVRVVPRQAVYQEEGSKMWNTAYGDAYDSYANLPTVKQANAEQIEAKRIRTSFYEKTIPFWNRIELGWNGLNLVQRIVVTATQGIILLISVYLVANKTITIGDLIAFNAYAGMIIGPFVSLGQQWQTIQNGLVSVARAEIVFDTPSEAYEPKDALRLSNIRGDVAFKDVHFTYEPDQPEVLKGMSFNVSAGEVVAFVGETGVGKSTTIELISGYYFANSGEVDIDGHDIRRVNLNDLRSQIAVVPQEIVLFNAPIADNIRYGRPNTTDEEVREAACKAHADVFIEKFPLGYKQEVGERGVKLSVGQKQRVAIARAILRDPKILILDEPTSALDAETERYITGSLEELMRGRTTFIIAHRLSTVRKADKILVMQEGKIVEQGRHDELVAAGGLYARLYNLHIGLHE